MNKKWIKYLCDPIDKTDLILYKVSRLVGDDIKSGLLKSKSGNIYKVKNGVPILLTSKTQSIATVDSFSYEWNVFDFDYGKKGWIEDVVKPVVKDLSYFKNKVIVDCGAGSGRQSLWMAQSGAKFIFSLELSNSSHSIMKKVTKFVRDRVFIIQCDISNPPINYKNINIDLIYCINVIQHTKNPRETLKELSSLMRSKTEFMFNIYLDRGRKKILTLLNIFRKITKIIPYKLIKVISFVTALFSFIASILPGIGGWLKKSLPIDHGFKETWLCIYDILGSHEYQKFYTEKELQDMLRYSRLKIKKRSKYALLLNKYQK